MFHTFKKIMFIILMNIIAFQSAADWQLSQQNSTVNFTTVKKEHVIENHYFENVSANISKEGKINLSIDLTSVNTKIAIRDQRIKEHLFNTLLFPKAIFTAQLNTNQLENLMSGSSKALRINGRIELHGQSQDVLINVLVTKLSKTTLLVASQESLIIKAQDFDLVAGINKLQALANLPSITHSVPVNFILMFTHQ
jgi:polyisoprenoid-binding protein YceI